MTNRRLDGCFFRVMRDGHGLDVCWTDLDWEDRIDMMNKHNHEDWLLRMIQIMNDVAERINDEFSQVCIEPVYFPMDK